MSHTFLPFFTNHGFMLDLPKFDLSKPQVRTYSLNGIPTSKPIDVWLALTPSGRNMFGETDASIAIRILAADGSIVISRENRFNEMHFTDHGMPGARWEAYFKLSDEFTLKKNEIYRLELKYHPAISNFPIGDANVTLEVSINP